MIVSDFYQVGKNIQYFMEKYSISIDILNSRTTIRKEIIEAILQGKKALNLTEFRMIAGALGITIEELLTQRGDISSLSTPKDYISPFFQEVIDNILLLEELENL